MWIIACGAVVERYLNQSLGSDPEMPTFPEWRSPAVSNIRQPVRVLVCVLSSTLIMAACSPRIDFGDDSGQFANDGECDDGRFVGNKMGLTSSERTDATDCRALYESGEIMLAAAVADESQPKARRENEASRSDDDPDTRAYEQCMTLHRRQQELASQIQRALTENVFIVEDLSAQADMITELYLTCRNNYNMSGGRRSLP